MSLLKEERTRIAHDLHDEQGPLLLMTRHLIEKLPGTAGEEEKLKAKAIANMNLLMNRFRNTVFNLRPETIVKRGLCYALEDFFGQCHEATGLHCHFRYHLTRTLPEDLKFQIYLLIQELTQNAIKHADASYIHLQLVEKNGDLFIYFRDNGKGFEPAPTMGTGLSSIHARVARMNATLNFSSEKLLGTEYILQLPITNNHEYH